MQQSMVGKYNLLFHVPPINQYNNQQPQNNTLLVLDIETRQFANEGEGREPNKKQQVVLESQLRRSDPTINVKSVQ